MDKAERDKRWQQFREYCESRETWATNDDWQDWYNEAGPVIDSVTFWMLDEFARLLGVPKNGFKFGDGSESVDGDLGITIQNLVAASGLVDEHGDVMTVAQKLATVSQPVNS